jgi:outer membrane protein assembly factor BamE (lipoprotein component of BamABCDE complex)
MEKKNLKNMLLMGMALLISVFLLAGCSQPTVEKKSSDDVTTFYNAVQLGETKADVEKALGVQPESKDSGYNYIDSGTGCGVTINYDDSKKVTSKAMYMPNDTYLDKLPHATVTQDQASSITQGMTYEQVKSLLGGVDGVQVTCAVNPADAANPVNVVAWINDDRTVVYVTFIGEKGTAVRGQFYQ